MAGRLPASRAGFVGAVSTLLRLLIALLVFGQPKHDPSVDRKRLQHDVISVAILVHERRTDREPKVVLSFALHDGERTIGRLGVRRETGKE